MNTPWKSVVSLGAVVLIGALGTTASTAAKPPTYGAQIMLPNGTVVGKATFVGVSAGGTQITVDVSKLPPGVHGMHVHENGSCNPIRDTQGNVTAFGAAGGHFDPASTNSHKGPDANGHAGDLPVINVDDSGNGRVAYYAANLHVSGPNSIVGRSIVIHANPDNYTDTPPNGGSGGRIACGEIGALAAT